MRNRHGGQFGVGGNTHAPAGKAGFDRDGGVGTAAVAAREQTLRAGGLRAWVGRRVVLIAIILYSLLSRVSWCYRSIHRTRAAATAMRWMPRLPRCRHSDEVESKVTLISACAIQPGWHRPVSFQQPPAFQTLSAQVVSPSNLFRLRSRPKLLDSSLLLHVLANRFSAAPLRFIGLCYLQQAPHVRLVAVLAMQRS